MKTGRVFVAGFALAVLLSTTIITYLGTYVFSKPAERDYVNGENSHSFLERNDIFAEGDIDGLTYFYNQKTKVQKSMTFLTLFTTFKEIRAIPHHIFAINLVLKNWPLLKPYIQPVVFLNFTNSSLARRARTAGWEVLPLGRTNAAGTPFLKDMYQTVFEKYKSTLYGYANGDLIFDHGILQTLERVQEQIGVLHSNVLLTGRRTNVFVDLKSGNPSPEEFNVDRLHQLASQKGKLIPGFAIDYFFFTKDGCSMNWSSLADVVIGRPAYDSYMVASALHQGVNVIDCTETLLAVHISENGTISHGRRNADSTFNWKLIGPKFEHTEGYATSAKLATSKDFAGNVFIHRRR